MMVGLELEWADVDRHMTLPTWLGAWNDKDYTLVNSDGHANDPTGADWRWGGEINTCPTGSASDQAWITAALAGRLRPVINYRCNLHVHVHPGVALLEDLELLKAVASYIRRSEPFIFETVEPIPMPVGADYPSDAAFAGAMKRYRRRQVSHHYRLPDARYAELLTAQTAKQALDAHAPRTRTGQRNFAIAPRPGLNLRSLSKHGTIEFRHFPGTADPDEIHECATWALAFTAAALRGGPPVQELWASRTWHFPEFRLYDHALETGYLATTYRPDATRTVRVHGEHQPVSGSPAAGAAPTRVGDAQRSLEWDGEPADES